LAAQVSATAAPGGPCAANVPGRLEWDVVRTRGVVATAATICVRGTTRGRVGQALKAVRGTWDAKRRPYRGFHVQRRPGRPAPVSGTQTPRRPAGSRQATGRRRLPPPRRKERPQQIG
jgi:hypothetical protein